jgi:hypothetical protein
MAAQTQTRNRNRTNLLLDASSFLAFLLVTAPHFTGMAIHEWLSVALGAALVTHLLLHWSWLAAVTRRFLGAATWNARLNYTLNALLFVCFTVALFTGLMISETVLPLFGLQLGHDGLWEQLHRLASDACVVLIGLHVALHWSWIVNTTRRLFARRSSRSAALPESPAVPASQEVL